MPTEPVLFGDISIHPSLTIIISIFTLILLLNASLASRTILRPDLLFIYLVGRDQLAYILTVACFIARESNLWRRSFTAPYSCRSFERRRRFFGSIFAKSSANLRRIIKVMEAWSIEMDDNNTLLLLILNVASLEKIYKSLVHVLVPRTTVSGTSNSFCISFNLFMAARQTYWYVAPPTSFYPTLCT